MKKIVIRITLVFFITHWSGVLSAQNYDLKSPAATYQLPDILREVSGITVINQNSVACVQDELGILFNYNLKKKKALQSNFYDNGDYEGIAAVGNDIYVLRSNGDLIQISDPFATNQKVVLHLTAFPANELEGLCYDEAHNRLLVAAKSISNGLNNAEQKRMIYSFDLQEMKSSPNPVITIDIQVIHDYLISQFNVSAEIDIKFNPSDIAIHPVTNKLYVLSAEAYLLCIFNDGVFESAEMLDKQTFNKAEGIVFFKNGDMLVSNEGPRKGIGNILLFKYKK